MGQLEAVEVIFEARQMFGSAQTRCAVSASLQRPRPTARGPGSAASQSYLWVVRPTRSGRDSRPEPAIHGLGVDYAAEP